MFTVQVESLEGIAAHLLCMSALQLAIGRKAEESHVDVAKGLEELVIKNSCSRLQDEGYPAGLIAGVEDYQREIFCRVLTTVKAEYEMLRAIAEEQAKH